MQQEPTQPLPPPFTPALAARPFLPLLQATRQVTRASVEWYGPDRPTFLGPFSGENTPSYLKGEQPALGLRAHAAAGGGGRPIL